MTATAGGLAPTPPNDAAYYLDGKAGWTLPFNVRMFDVARDYGGAFDGFLIPDNGAINSGSHTLNATNGTFTSNDVGKIISVTGAGIGGVDLETTISSHVSSTQVSLTDAASTSVTAADVYYGTNDRDAWQNCINAAMDAAFSPVYGYAAIIMYPAGISCVSGAFQDTSYSNSMLYFPRRTGDDYVDRAQIIFRGPIPTNWVNAGDVAPWYNGWSGTMIKVFGASLAAGGSFLSAKETTARSSYNKFQLKVVFDGLQIRLPTNPTFTGLDLTYIATVQTPNLKVDSGHIKFKSVPEPTTSSSYGIKFPQSGNNAELKVGPNLSIAGFYNGITGEEHATGLAYITSCKNAVYMRIGYFPFTVNLAIMGCPTLFKVSAACVLNVSNIDIENRTSAYGWPAWQNVVYAVDDASNLAYGKVTWFTYYLISPGFPKNGGSNLRCEELITGTVT